MVSETQTQGRGRSGKRWESPAGGLWLSIILRPRIAATETPLVQFLASNATTQAIERETGIKPLAKWPNDLMLETGKLGGILVETKTKSNVVSFAIVGIGLNVNQERDLLPPGAISLHLMTGIKFELAQLLRAIVSELRASYIDLENPERLLEAWWKNCVHRPRRVQVELPTGTITGISKGVDTEGNLLVETDNHKTERITEGTLKLLD